MDKAKKDFIFKKGVLGVGVTTAFLMAITAGFQVPGAIFQWQGFNVRTFVTFLAVFLPIFSVAGYFWGVILYRWVVRRRNVDQKN
jgi:hypothetical protein